MALNNSFWKNVFPDELFNQNADLTHYRCVTCNGVPIKPHQHSICGHIFCEDCATSGIKRRHKQISALELLLSANFPYRSNRGRRPMTIAKESIFCQGCEKDDTSRLVLREFYVDRARMKDMERIMIKCPNCGQWRGQLRDYIEGHRKICNR